MVGGGRYSKVVRMVAHTLVGKVLAHLVLEAVLAILVHRRCPHKAIGTTQLCGEGERTVIIIELAVEELTILVGVGIDV